MSSENKIYSVKLRKGPDVAHYDLVFEDAGLRLLYLGEYWEHHRPRRGLQRSADLLLYKLNKRKNRETARNFILIDYCEIIEYSLEKPRVIRRKKRLNGRTIVEERVEPPRLHIVTRSGEHIVLEFSPKVYELAKRLVKRKLAAALREKCAKR